MAKRNIKEIPTQSEKLRNDITNHYYTVVNNSHLLCFWKVHYVGEYCNYIASIILEVLKRNDLQINIVINGNVIVDFNNDFRTLYIKINFEHTLLKQVREEDINLPVGKIPDGDGEFYYVRIDDFDNVNNSDIAIDYSIPNLHNIQESGIYDEFVKKTVYISPSLYDTLALSKVGRSSIILTSFIFPELPRRKIIIDSIKSSGLDYYNMFNLFDKNSIKQIYLQVKILINIHQTNYAHSFEELRVLPALQCGVIVVCEDSPLRELIPYNNLIVWSPYEKIVEKAAEVLANYDTYYSKIFSEENISLLKGLHGKNVDSLEKKILELK